VADGELQQLRVGLW